MAKLSFFIITFSLLSSLFASEKVKIKEINFNEAPGSAKVSIKLDGRYDGTPELLLKDNILQVAIPGSIVWPKIEKQVSINEKFDTKLTAYQYSKDLVRFRAILPFKIEGKNNNVAIMLKDGAIEVGFPSIKTNKTVTIGRKPAIVEDKVEQVNKYDETYLDKLLKDKESIPEVNLNAQNSVKTTTSKKSDEVNVTLSSSTQNTKSTFSLTKYIGKFVAFLSLILLGFWGVAQIMKKGVFKKSKLGFLNSTKSVEILNTTYVGPKKSLILVKAHNQVFLVGAGENGMNLISEINDVTGLIKSGEQQVSGSNFDTNMVAAQNNVKQFKLKEVYSVQNDNVNENNNSDQEGSLTSFLEKKPVEDKVKLSDQIKSKVKNLKSLQ